MANPMLVEVLRGNIVESRHRGSGAVVDGDGKIVLSFGDIDLPVFPRSAVKAIQALPLIESGAADAFGFGERELALACASHNGETEHVALAASMLERAGLGEPVLECGAHWPSYQPATVALARSGGTPTALHNNCSGKHSGFLCTCVHAGIAERGYSAAGHPLQELVREALADVTGATHGEDNRGTDGCSIPTYAVPLINLARGFAKMGTGIGLAPERAAAAKRLINASMAHPFLIAGTASADTTMMAAVSGRVFVKYGAEGVYCATIPELGLGIALKCDDGAKRAVEVMVAALLARLLATDEALSAIFAEMARPVLTNWNGISVASLRPAGVLA